jgi:hypothetical protein
MGVEETVNVNSLSVAALVVMTKPRFSKSALVLQDGQCDVLSSPSNRKYSRRVIFSTPTTVAGPMGVMIRSPCRNPSGRVAASLMSHTTIQVLPITGTSVMYYVVSDVERKECSRFTKMVARLTHTSSLENEKEM